MHPRQQLRRFARLLAAVGLLGVTGCSAAVRGASDAPRAVFPAGSQPNGIYSPGILVEDFLFLSGQIGIRGAEGPIADVAGQTRQALENIRAILEAAGADMRDVVKCSVFLADIADYGAMNDVYRTVWPSDAPARTTVAVAGLPANALVEIECWAWVGG